MKLQCSTDRENWDTAFELEVEEQDPASASRLAIDAFLQTMPHEEKQTAFDIYWRNAETPSLIAVYSYRPEGEYGY